MTNDNYIRHLKVLGKLVFVYDEASAQVDEHRDYLAVTCDQIATGLAIDNDALTALAANLPSWNLAISSGPESLKVRMTTLLEAYIKTAMFCDTIVETTVNANQSATVILQALAVEMDTDTKTLTEQSYLDHGLAAFFESEYASQTTWETPFPIDSPGSYPDETYVVGTIV